MTAPKQAQNTRTPIDWAFLVERIAEATGCKRGPGGQWTGGSCPVHGRKDNFSVKLGANGKAVVKCFSGCDQDALIDALHAQNLWPDKGELKSEAEAAGERIAARRAAEQKREQERKAAEEETQRRAWEVWNETPPASPDPGDADGTDFHPYNMERGAYWTGDGGYLRRGPWPFNGKRDKDALIMALVDVDGDLWSLEALGSRADIFDLGKGKGRKAFMPGAMRDGIFFTFREFGAHTKTFHIGEGFFTVQAALQSGDVDGDGGVADAAWIAALSAGNLKPVATAIRARYPDARIIILADEDPAGIDAAMKAAHAVGGLVARPSAAWPEGAALKHGYDFADLIHDQGPEKVREIVAQAQPPFLKDTAEAAARAEETRQRTQEEDQDERKARLRAEARAMLAKAPAIDIWEALTVEPPPRDYILNGYLPTGIVSILAAPGSTGKSFLSSVIATAVASGRSIPPFEVKAPAPVLVISAEDDARDIKPRIYRIGKEYKLTHWEMQSLRNNLNVRPMRGIIGPLMERGPYGAAPQATAGTEALAILMEEHKPALVILDTKSRLFGLTENTAEDNSAWINNLEALLADHPDTSFLVLSHTGKKSIEVLKTQNAERGSSASTDNARAGFVYLKHIRKHRNGEEEHLTTPDGAKLFVLSHVKSNYAAPRPDAYFIQGYGGVPVMVEDPKLASEASRRLVLATALGVLCRELAKRPNRSVRLTPLLDGKAKSKCTDDIRAIREYLKMDGGIDGDEIEELVNYGIEAGKLIREEDPNSTAHNKPPIIRLANPPQESPQGELDEPQDGLFDPGIF